MKLGTLLGLGLTLAACSSPAPGAAGPDVDEPGNPDGGQGVGDGPSTPENLLRWSPPDGYESYETINIDTSDPLPTLDDETDYLLVMPPTPRTQPLVINGGRNVVMIGGEIDLDVPVESDSKESALRGIYIVNGSVQGRIVHIEGVLIHSTSNTLSDAFHISRGETGNHFMVQIQNVRIGPLPPGNFKGTLVHPDMIQTWGSVGELRIDRLTGISNYQGLFFKADSNGQHGPVHISNTNLRGDDEGRYLLWMSSAGGNYPTVTLEELWVEPSTGRSFGKSVWPDVDDTAQLGSGEITWPSLPVTGSVKEGAPPEGDFVRAEDVGIGYVSPGYL